MGGKKMTMDDPSDFVAPHFLPRNPFEPSFAVERSDSERRRGFFGNNSCGRLEFIYGAGQG